MTATFHVMDSENQTSGAASFFVPLSIQPFAAGDSCVVVASWDAASTVTPTVVASGGVGTDTFTLIYGPFSDGVVKYGAWLLSSLGSGRLFCTLSWTSSNPAFADAWCEAFTGVPSPVLDGFAKATGSGTALSSGNTATLTTSDQFAIAYAATQFSTVAAAVAPWTDDLGEATGSRAAHRVLSATTAITSTFTEPDVSTWVTFCLTFTVVAVTTSVYIFSVGQSPGASTTHMIGY